MDELSKIKILLVDDNPNNLVALSAMLSHPDYDLIPANSGSEALRWLLHEEFALVLLDVMMPEMDGFEVASIMKRSIKTHYIPIIFVTAIARDMKDIFQGYASGGVDYIQKPLDPDIVRAKVAVFADLFRQKKEVQRQAEIIRNSERARFLEKERIARLRAEAAEKRYYDLINWVDHAVLWEYDPLQQKFAFMSKRSLEILGYSPDYWLNDPYFFIKHIHPDDRMIFEEMLEKASLQGKDGRCEHRFFRSDGEMLWVHSGINPRKDSQGKVNLLWGLTVDITGFKTAEVNQRFLTQASAVLSSSLDSTTTLNKVAHLIVSFMADWCIVELRGSGQSNPVVASHSSPEIHATIRALLHKISVKTVLMTTVPDAFLVSASQNEEHLQKLKNLQIVSLMAVPLKLRDKILGAVILISCNPYRHYSEKDLSFVQELAWHMSMSIENSRLYDEAMHAIQLREELLGIVSHDLKSPLTAIDMSAQMIARGGRIDPKIAATKIHQLVLKMAHLISDLLDLSRIDAGVLSIEKRSFRTQELIQETIDVVIDAAQEKGISITKELPEQPVLIPMDHDRILQVLLNIVGNAIKFSPTNGTITLGMKKADREYLFWVADTGPGIPKEEVPFLFERFRQAKEGKRYKGSIGLGLYISKKMIEAHGGKIWVKTAPGQGSTFFFTLPIPETERFQTPGAA